MDFCPQWPELLRFPVASGNIPVLKNTQENI